MPSPPVIFIHDAAIDEYMATVLLTTLADWELLGVVIVNADCIGGPAMQAAWKIHSLLGRPSLPLALSGARAINPFPWNYRADCIRQAQIPLLASIPENYDWPTFPVTCASGGGGSREPPPAPTVAFPSGEELLRQLLADAVRARSPVTVLATCPLTPLQLVLDADPALAAGVAQLVWMGGSFDGRAARLGGVPCEAASSGSEWNAFWDPPAVDRIFRSTTFPIHIVPAETARLVPLTQDFMDSLAAQSRQGRLLSTLALQSYATVFGREPGYALWDVLTASYLAQPRLFAPPSSRCVRMIASGYHQGVIVPDPAGRLVQVLTALKDPAEFYAFVTRCFLQ